MNCFHTNVTGSVDVSQVDPGPLPVILQKLFRNVERRVSLSVLESQRLLVAGFCRAIFQKTSPVAGVQMACGADPYVA